MLIFIFGIAAIRIHQVEKTTVNNYIDFFPEDILFEESDHEESELKENEQRNSDEISISDIDIFDSNEIDVLSEIDEQNKNINSHEQIFDFEFELPEDELN